MSGHGQPERATESIPGGEAPEERGKEPATAHAPGADW
jgi:hypothetical protein